MKVAGIIAEFDPFHNGHEYLIEHTRAEKEGGATHVVAVMSGCFTQRGTLALLDPYRRVRAALLCGVDLVVELPLPWCLASAQRFAQGGVFLLSAVGADLVSFGSECGEVEPLQKLCGYLLSDRVSQRLRGLMQTGLPYAAAQRQAVAETAGEKAATLLDFPNNTLAVEYLLANRALAKPMQPFTVKRFGAAHDDFAPVGGMASASFLRETVRAGRVVNTAPYVPGAVLDLLTSAVGDGVCPSSDERIERAVLAVLRQRSQEELRSLPALSEGIENRLFHAVEQADSLESLIALAKTKRYSRTRLQRLIWCAFLGVTADDAEGVPPYVRVLGATKEGLSLLRRARENGTKVPFLTRSSQIDSLGNRAKRIFALECRAYDLYALALPRPYPCGSAQTHGFLRVE